MTSSEENKSASTIYFTKTHFLPFWKFLNSSYEVWESISFGSLGLCPTSAVFHLTLHTRDLICCSQRFQNEQEILRGLRSAHTPVSSTHWRMVAEAVTALHCSHHISYTEASLVAVDERWYHPVGCHLVSSFVLIRWRISPLGSNNARLGLLLVFASCFLGMMQLT